MARRVRSFWVITSAIFENPEKHIAELEYLGADEIFILVPYETLCPNEQPVGSDQPKSRDIINPVLAQAKKHGLKVHAWIVSLRRPSSVLTSSHKDWYVVNRNGDSCVDKPAYIPDYKWLCPSQKAPSEYLLGAIHKFLERFDVDGIELDYIRFPDMFLPKALRPNYGLDREREVYRPEFDFCYCDTCREGFKRDRGPDPFDVEFGSKSWYQWVRWRSDSLTSFVSRFHRTVKSYDASIETSATVFATPGLAYRYVFQRWAAWPLDHLEPMIYHEYYDKPVEWIGEAVAEGISTGKRIIAGVLLGFLRRPEDIHEATKSAVQNGAEGICCYSYPIAHNELREELRSALSKV
ncbi:Tat pathway signal protein [bacterium]|nr:MAG: Tat pathway signal protein [bacterium]